MKTTICALALVAAMAVPGATLAQDASLTANFGEISLRTGFTPDPYRVSMAAGGGIDAYADTDLPAACVGNITDAPDFEVTYTDGSWSCDDDSYGDGDAEVRFNRPQSGTYDIWVGTFGGGTAPATLLITETP